MGTLADVTALDGFLLARVAEDEAAACAEYQWDQPHWARCHLIWVADWHQPQCTCDMRRRVLAQCAAVRVLVAEWRELEAEGPLMGMARRGRMEGLWTALAELAAVYADHPDYPMNEEKPPPAQAL